MILWFDDKNINTLLDHINREKEKYPFTIDNLIKWYEYIKSIKWLINNYNIFQCLIWIIPSIRITEIEANINILNEISKNPDYLFLKLEKVEDWIKEFY